MSRKDEIRDFLENQIVGKKVANDHPLFASGVIDSLGHMKLISFLEKQYQLVFTMDELQWEKFATIDLIDALVAGKLK
jgi:methoxymalonate biosynthesis acyl carrier protein